MFIRYYPRVKSRLVCDVDHRLLDNEHYFTDCWVLYIIHDAIYFLLGQFYKDQIKERFSKSTNKNIVWKEPLCLAFKGYLKYGYIKYLSKLAHIIFPTLNNAPGEA